MDINAVHDAIRTLGSLASMASAYLAFRRDRREMNSNDREKILDAAESTTIDQPSDDLLRALMVIPDAIFDAAKKRIEKPIKKYEKVLQSPNTRPVDLEDEYEKASEMVCEFLRLIRRHNGDVLPGDESLQNLWKSFQCVPD